MSNIVHTNGYKPAIAEELERHQILQQYVSGKMVQTIDYGVVPGTKSKPTLLKPGAEKLCRLFGLSTRFQLIESIQDFTGKNHDDEPFFFYFYRCSVWHGELLIAECDASCNSWEKKYRHRESKPTCPKCQNQTIRKSEKEFYCWNKIGGCGARFALNFEGITSQSIGLIPNSEIFDQINTIQKMAQKRALIGAVLIATGASEFFTQDLEDIKHPNGFSTV